VIVPVVLTVVVICVLAGAIIGQALPFNVFNGPQR
jgi:hypothetical protein